MISKKTLAQAVGIWVLASGGIAKAQTGSTGLLFVDDIANTGLVVETNSAKKAAVFPRPKQTDDKLIKEIAEAGAPETVKFKKGTNLVAFIVNKCGAYSAVDLVHPAYRGAVRWNNPSLSDDEWSSLKEDTTITIPACARFVGSPQTVAAPKGVEAAARKENIPFATDVFRASIINQSLRAALQDAGKTINRADSRIEFAEYVTKLPKQIQDVCDDTKDIINYTGCVNALSVVATNPNIRDPDKGIGEVRILSSSRTIGDEQQLVPVTDKWQGVSQPTFELIPAVTHEYQTPATAAQQPPSDSCARSHIIRGTNNWPIDVAALLRVVSHVGLPTSPPSKVPAGILVADTGFDFFPPQVGEDKRSMLVQAAFPGNYFHRTLLDSDKPDQESRRDGNFDGVPMNGGAAAVNLASPEGRVGSETPRAAQRRSHGLSVATLALGGRDLEQIRRLAKMPIAIAPVSLLRREVDVSPITSDHVYRTLSYAVAPGNKVDVVNLSLTAPSPIAGMLETIRRQGRGKLLVVAAGNAGKQIVEFIDDADKQITAYPAAWGGEIRNLEMGDLEAQLQGMIVSVGAHDANGKRASFSNHGMQVDILAPGCSVPSYEIDSGEQSSGDATALKPAMVTGTSFAAPVVSFVAGLLSAYPWTTPGLVKARLQVSGDYDPDLQREVFSSSILNPAKALATKFDIMEFLSNPNGTFSIGRIDPNSLKDVTFRCTAGEFIKFERIQKIARGTSNDPVLVFHLSNPSNRISLKRSICEPSFGEGAELSFANFETGETKKYPLVSIRDFVAKFE